MISFLEKICYTFFVIRFRRKGIINYIGKKEFKMDMEEKLNFDDFSDMTVTLELENGSQLECDVVLVFYENGRNYIALMPSEQTVGFEEADLYFYRLTGASMEELGIGNIEDDEEYQEVAERFEEIMDEQEFSDILTEEN